MDESPLFTSTGIDELNIRFEHASPEELLVWAHNSFRNKVALGTGFGSSGVVLLHILHKEKLPVKVFSLDTSLLFEETYALWKQLENRYSLKIESVASDLTLSEQAEVYGNALWQTDPDRCCTIRKVKPLQHYLTDKAAWISGIRQAQSPTRKLVRKIEWDPVNCVLKINPLADWSSEKVWELITRENIPYNPLYDDGYSSIGCAPCTTSACNGDNERACRWVNFNKTECGIHLPVLTGKPK